MIEGMVRSQEGGAPLRQDVLLAWRPQVFRGPELITEIILLGELKKEEYRKKFQRGEFFFASFLLHRSKEMKELLGGADKVTPSKY